MFENYISNCILTVGPDFKNHRGGIGAVIEGYSHEFKPFHFISTYRPLHKFLAPLYSIPQLIYLPFYLLFNRNIKIVHIHGSSRGSFLRKYFVFVISKYFFRKKIVYHIHSGGFPEYYRKSNFILKKSIQNLIGNADAVICLSKSWETFYLKNFHLRQIEVIPNVVKTSSFDRPEGDQNQKVVFLFLGKICKNKGVYDFMEVARDLNKKYPGSFEIWVGGNGEVKTFSALIVEEKLGETVKFLGWISGEDKINYLKKAGVFLLPSYFEGLPVALLEAMAFSMPVISTKVGGIPELVKDKKSGFLIEPGDKEALKASMEAFIVNKSLINEMGRQSFDIIEKDYTTEVAMEKLNILYKQLLNEAGSNERLNLPSNKKIKKYAAR